MKPTDLWELLTKATRIITVLIVPYGVYVTTQLEKLNTQVALLQQRIDLSTAARDQQITDMIALYKDHETRIRTLENVH